MSMPRYRDSQVALEERVQDLLSRLSLEEKAAQLHQTPVAEAGKEAVRQEIAAGRVGSLILAGTATASLDPQTNLEPAYLNELQRLAVESSPHGIPMLYGRDVIHGHRTVFPIPLGLAATFDPEIVEEACAVAAREAASEGVHWTFAPMVDISRDPRWGRIAESFGEDPWLASLLARAAVRGFQGDNPAEPDRLLACAKHFVGYGGAEGGRDYDTAEITENTLRNIYLPPFKAACEGGCATIMSGFHDLNGESASANRALLTGVLREEWKWDGMVVSDWGSINDVIAHGQAADERQAAALSFGAGVDMDMCTDMLRSQLPALVKAGVIPLSRLDEAVSRVLRAKMRAGLFERPYVDLEVAPRVMREPRHLQAAQVAAANACVLLKNREALLPLRDHDLNVAVLGPLIEDRRLLLGTWTLDGRAEETPNFWEGLREVAPRVRFHKGNPSLTDQAALHVFGTEAIIVGLGEDQSRSGEHNSVADVSLPAGQVEFVRALRRWGKPIVAVVFTGRPLALGELEPLVDALLIAWHPGSRGAHAVAEVLFGHHEPGGRLPASFPRVPGMIPCHYNHKPTGKHFGREGATLPHHGSVRHRYLDTPGDALYPFGFGLTYTDFSYANLKIEPGFLSVDALEEGVPFLVSLEVTNVGERPGTAIVQCYVRDQVSETTRPVRELKGLQRAHLQPQQTRRVRFTLTAEELGFHGRDGSWKLEPGDFTIFAGADSRAPLAATLRVVE